MQAARQLFLFVLLVSAGIVASASMVETTPDSEKPPNIILITLDTTRADRMGFLGSKRGLTPNLDALALQSAVFTRAYAQVPLTTPSHAALLTGTYPQFNHVAVLRDPLRAELPYLPEILQEHGYQTAAFVGSMILDPSSGAPGFDRGFDVYEAGFHMAKRGEGRYHSVERRAEDVANHALDWVRRQQGPFFLWIHFFDPHDPYDPPQPFKTRFKSAPYDGEIAYADSVVGSVLGVLKSHGLFENSAIVVAADHGEAFGEHGEKRHGLLLYDETIHVPLLLKLPAEKYAGRRIDTRVALADIAPSLLETAEIAVPAAMQAQSLLPLMEVVQSAGDITKQKPVVRPVYSETDYAHRTLGWSEMRSWRTGKYFYVQAPERELYDQTLDPKALKNLAPTARAVADTLDTQLSEFRDKTSSSRGERSRLDPAQAESLHALGYLASNEGKENRIEKPLVNPKEKVEIADLLQEAIVALEENRYNDAMADIRKVVRDPDAVNAYLEFGVDLVQHKRYADAVPLLEKAVEKLPGSASARYELGIALVNTGRWEAALPQMQAAVALNPDSASLHFNLAAVNIRLKHYSDAIAECEKALALEPDHFDTNLTYGRLLLQQQHPDTALPRLVRAVAVRPQSAEAHFFLAEAYQELGQTENANQERAKAIALRAQPNR